MKTNCRSYTFPKADLINRCDELAISGRERTAQTRRSCKIIPFEEFVDRLFPVDESER